ncbi:DUF4435 domain-containing protein [Pedobacter sp. GR22-6]|uniref:DUF4435 domain-containing protein n=1 Tax=Pedobacter sp. GR22-6 TaxID=3127957 RepID=UPI00307E7F44
MEIILNEIPTRSERARYNAGILYDQFNELNFFVEDETKEDFYLNILRKIFPMIQLTKIFGIGRKDVVKKAARENSGSKKDIYIVDLDFDHLNDTKEHLPNLIYLERYSIENYLMEEDSLIEYVKEEKAKSKKSEIKKELNLAQLLKMCSESLSILAGCYLIISRFRLKATYYSINLNRDINFGHESWTFRQSWIPDYIMLVKQEFEQKYPDENFSDNLALCQACFTMDNFIKNFPGKMLLSILKFKLNGKFGISDKTTDESFAYRLGKNSGLESLHFLRDKVDQFLN